MTLEDTVRAPHVFRRGPILQWVALGAVAALWGCAPEPLEERRAVAARRGIEWLIGHREGMSQEWAHSIFPPLYKIAPEGELADAVGAIVEEISRRPIVVLPPDLDDPRLLRFLKLRPVLAELVRRRHGGEAWAEPTRQLQALLRRQETTLWRHLRFTQQLVLLQMFGQLGIETERIADDVIQEIRARWLGGEREGLLVDLEFMLAVTHVFITGSDYFSRYLDAGDYGPEIEMLRAAARRYRSELPESRFFLDLQAEILAARKLVRLPEDEDALAMAERLLALQHGDGGWGESVQNHPLHATFTAVLGLLDYPPRLRGTPNGSPATGR